MIYPSISNFYANHCCCSFSFSSVNFYISTLWSFSETFFCTSCNTKWYYSISFYAATVPSLAIAASSYFYKMFSSISVRFAYSVSNLVSIFYIDCYNYSISSLFYFLNCFNSYSMFPIDWVYERCGSSIYSIISSY